MKDLTISRPFNEDEYNELLRQAVAVIEISRLQIAKQLNTVAMSSYWVKAAETLDAFVRLTNE